MISCSSYSGGPAAGPGAAGLLRPDPGGSAPPHWLRERESESESERERGLEDVATGLGE